MTVDPAAASLENRVHILKSHTQWPFQSLFPLTLYNEAAISSLFITP